MKIAIISFEYPPLTNWGGIATFNYYLAHLLCQLGHEVHVLCFDNKGYQYYKRKDNDISVHYIPLRTDIKILNFFYYKIFPGILRTIIKKHLARIFLVIDWNIFATFKFRQLNNVVGFDIVHTPSYYLPAFLINLLNQKITFFLHIHGPQYILNLYDKPFWDNKILAYLEKFYIKHSQNTLITPSNNLKNKITDITKRKNTICLPNFVKIEDYYNNENVDKNKIVFFGRLEYRKGVDILIKAFINLSKKNKNLKSYLIGSKDTGANFDYQEKKVDFDTLFEKLNIPAEIEKRIYFFPNISEKKALIELLKSLKGIAVFPARYEPFGFSTVEAMAMGYLAIASNKGGGKEIIDDKKDGYLTNPDTNSLVKTISSIHNLPNKSLKKVSKAAQQKVSKSFSFKSAQQLVENLYNKTE